MPIADYLPIRDDNANVSPGNIRANDVEVQQTINSIRQLMADLAAFGLSATFVDLLITGNLTVNGDVTVGDDLTVGDLILMERSYAFKGLLHDCQISNNAGDAVNDIDFAAGYTSSDNFSIPTIMVCTALTKRLDANWVAGTNQGGLDTGAIANGTYHCHRIKNPTTGVVDALFSLSPNAPTLPAGFTLSRRIGSILREAATIIPFFQNGNFFLRVPVNDRNSTAAAAAALLALSVPTGISVSPIINVAVQGLVSVNCQVQLGSAAEGAAGHRAVFITTGAGDSSEFNIGHFGPGFIWTNTARQIYFAQANVAGTPSSSVLTTDGWMDRRGRDI